MKRTRVEQAISFRVTTVLLGVAACSYLGLTLWWYPLLVVIVGSINAVGIWLEERE